MEENTFFLEDLEEPWNMDLRALVLFMRKHNRKQPPWMKHTSFGIAVLLGAAVAEWFRRNCC